MNARTQIPKRRTRRARRWSVLTVLALALTGAWMYLSLSPRELVGRETGHVILVRDAQSRGALVRRHATIQLASGELVTARIPRGVHPQNDEDVRVSIYEGRWPPYSRSYVLAIERE